MGSVFINILSGTIYQATPLLYVALGGLIASRAGILDVGLEGKMLAGSFVGAVVSYYTGSASFGLFAAILTGAALGWFMWVCHRQLEVDIVISGLALNLLVASASVFFLRELFNVRGSLISDQIVGFEPLFPGIPDILFFGSIFSSLTILDYLAPIVALAIALTLWLSRIGIHLRASGYGDGSTALTRGISVDFLRGSSLVIGGALAAVGGAYLSITVLTSFVENMTAGRGFLAIALLLIGRSQVGTTLLWTYIFGLALSLESVLQIIHIPNQFVLSLPYITTLLILVVWNRKHQGEKKHAILR